MLYSAFDEWFSLPKSYNRCTGTSQLIYAFHETYTPIATTTYYFEPFHPPVIRTGAGDELAANMFNMVKKCFTTRAVRFESLEWGVFEYRYGGRGERKANGESNDGGEVHNF